MKKSSICIIAIVVILIGSIWAIVLTTTYEDEIVDCYDRNWNKIIGEICLEENSLEGGIEMAIVLTIITSLIFGCMVSLNEIGMGWD